MKTRKQKFLNSATNLLIASLVLVVAGGANASSISCAYTTDVQLTSIQESANLGTNLISSSAPYNSYACGGYGGNDMPYADGASNIGLRNDGFMNMDLATLNMVTQGSEAEGYDFNQIFNAPGSIAEELQVLGSNYEVQVKKNGNGSVVEPGVLALSDPNAADDPGWIQLGKMDTGSDKVWGSSEFSTVNGQAINDFLSISFTNGGNNAGTWSIGVNENSITGIENILGRQATFDHLALVLKAGNGFYIYDFDFKDIFASEFVAGNVFDFRTEYTFSGMWDTSLLSANLSHASVWVRDPALQPPDEVNAPATLGLMLASLIGMGVLRRRKLAGCSPSQNPVR